jgi:hypothetical protein
MSTTYVERQRRYGVEWQRWCQRLAQKERLEINDKGDVNVEDLHTHVQFGVEWQRWCWCQWLAPMTYTHKGFGTKQWMWYQWFAPKKGGDKGGPKLNDEGDVDERQIKLLLECKGTGTKAACCGTIKEFRFREIVVHPWP